MTADVLDVFQLALVAPDVPWPQKVQVGRDILDRLGIGIEHQRPAPGSTQVNVLTTSPALDQLLHEALDETRRLADVHRARVLDVEAEEPGEEQGEEPMMLPTSTSVQPTQDPVMDGDDETQSHLGETESHPGHETGSRETGSQLEGTDVRGELT